MVEVVVTVEGVNVPVVVSAESRTGNPAWPVGLVPTVMVDDPPAVIGSGESATVRVVAAVR